MKVLITGHKGFIGKNLIDFLKDKKIQIYGHGRENMIEELEKTIKNIDFIFHLAGEVRPKSEDKLFEESNLGLTKSIIDILEKNNLKIPILMASTIHAENPKNAYGTTKKEAEELLIEYSAKNKTPIYIYRLPHVFGEGCKPNYNSVISTWLYNSIINKEILVFDRGIKMNYVYVQDIVKEFCKHLEKKSFDTFYKIPENYITTLGDVVDYIEEFNNQEKTVLDNKFKEKLYKVYLDYLNKYKNR